MKSDGKHAEVTELIIRAFYTVYNTLGYGFLEKVYRRAMIIELSKLGLQAIEEAAIQVYYDGQIVGNFSADILVADKVIVETKSKRTLLEEHEAQLLHYLKSTICEVGLLLNFGTEPQVKRKVYDNDRKGGLSWTKMAQINAG
ncbi:GxxExxY protein [candidate division KSB1 bacterium]|nr:GxxExxY protein [candidate division KSB1 bacterium]